MIIWIQFCKKVLNLYDLILLSFAKHNGRISRWLFVWQHILHSKKVEPDCDFGLINDGAQKKKTLFEFSSQREISTWLIKTIHQNSKHQAFSTFRRYGCQNKKSFFTMNWSITVFANIRNIVLYEKHLKSTLGLS